MLPVLSGTRSWTGAGGPPAASAGGVVAIEVGVVGLLRLCSALTDGEMVCENRDNDGNDYSILNGRVDLWNYTIIV